ncbi:MAG TPA: prephenate dehydrogenase/arogenate dehydrogenase family protein [Casimicrobiaceae bacterium]|nr:prephenate dehydrogenase/arogenate dehydrogenase family protein [Casimicrobiaceae bacterium]
MAPRFGRIVVVGVGLIGGSVALALKRRGMVGEVVGIGRSQPNLDDALAAGVVDRACTLAGRWTDEVAGADVVVLAAPVAQFPALFAALAPALPAHAVLTDAGSTKQDVVAAARAGLGPAFPRFVPAHPIAGTEHSGARAAFATLYDGRQVILTPEADTDPHALEAIAALWEACGARVTRLAADRHDRIYAAVSHFPHMLAAAYMAGIAGRPDAGEITAYAGTGFRDVTRIAASSPEMWRDIGIANRAALLDELRAFRGPLDALEQALRDNDAPRLEALLAIAAWARRSWAAQRADPDAVE